MKTFKSLAVACGLALAVFAASSPDAATAGGCHGGSYFGGGYGSSYGYDVYTPVYQPVYRPTFDYGYDYGYGHDCYSVRKVVVRPSYLDSHYGW